MVAQGSEFPDCVASRLEDAVTSSLPQPEPVFARDQAEPQHCKNCGGVQIFIPCIVIEGRGRVGVCWGCDQEVFVPFTRVNGEAA